MPVTIDLNSVIYALSLLGLVAFAVSGALVAIEKKMDVIGVVVVATVTAIGGGTLRDLFLGISPVWWIQDTRSLYIALLSGFVVAFYRPGIKSLIVADAIGLAVFTIAGVSIALHENVTGATAVLMGTITGVAGGMIRDLLCDRIPLVLQKEIYATASLAGGTLYLLGTHTPLHQGILSVISMTLILTIRLISVKYSWRVPFPLKK